MIGKTISHRPILEKMEGGIGAVHPVESCAA
jgi:hypothetical protein